MTLKDWSSKNAFIHAVQLCSGCNDKCLAVYVMCKIDHLIDSV